MDNNIAHPLNMPEANLSVIDWAKLKSGDNEEGTRLIEACENRGFFYLNLLGDESFMEDHKAVLGFMDDYFHQDLATKMVDSRQSDTHGSVFHSSCKLIDIDPGQLQIRAGGHINRCTQCVA